MRRILIKCGIVAVCALIICYFIGIRGISNISGAISCKIRVGVSADSNRVIEFTLTDEEFHIAKQALNFQPLYRDNPSCGFSDDHSFIFVFDDARTVEFHYALDTCGHYQFNGSDLYVMSDAVKEKLNKILRKFSYQG